MTNNDLGRALISALRQVKSGDPLADIAQSAGMTKSFGSSQLLALQTAPPVSNRINAATLIDLRGNDDFARIYTVTISVTPQQDPGGVARFLFGLRVEWGVGSTRDTAEMHVGIGGTTFTLCCQNLKIDIAYQVGSANVDWLATATIARYPKGTDTLPESIIQSQLAVAHAATSAAFLLPKFARRLIVQTDDAAGTLAGKYLVHIFDFSGTALYSVATNGIDPIDLSPDAGEVKVENATAATDTVVSIRALLDFG